MTLARDTADFGRFGKNRNFLINGNFDIWQRGTSFTSGYAADRWSVSGSPTISRQAFTVGQTEVPNNPRYYMRVVGGAGTANGFSQKIEGVRSFSGKTITLSFWAKASAALTLDTIRWRQNFGTGGSSEVITTIGSSISITTSWAKYTWTVAIPSISGKTIGSSDDDYLQLEFRKDSTAFTLDVAQFQVEEGYVATPFDKRPEAIELLMCLRYFQTSSVNNHFGLLRASDSSSLRIGCDYVVPMRGTPSITLVGTLRLNHSTSIYASSLSNIYHNDVDGATLVFSSLTGLTPTAGDCVIGDFGSNNGSSTNYITFDAEL